MRSVETSSVTTAASQHVPGKNKAAGVVPAASSREPPVSVALDVGVMDEDVLVATLERDEAVTLLGVKEFDRSSCHYPYLFLTADAPFAHRPRQIRAPSDPTLTTEVPKLQRGR